MKVIKFYSLLLSLMFSVSFGLSNVKAQEVKPEVDICTELKKSNLSISDDKFVVAGEVYAPSIFKVKNQPLDVFQAIAMVGGIRKTVSEFEIVLIKCSPSIKITASLKSEDFRKIKKGIKIDVKLSDLEIKGGEIVMVLDTSSKETPSILPAFKPSHCGLFPN
ncbi:MAG: hypothetical protein LC768_16090 [Acidobacteria bacterium]|nr:hypothetical protein [Acidobacteriota bacterium]MCA1639820.1 hypothetical protein [Acidobacteriota bacterium]